MNQRRFEKLDSGENSKNAKVHSNFLMFTNLTWDEAKCVGPERHAIKRRSERKIRACNSSMFIYR